MHSYQGPQQDHSRRNQPRRNTVHVWLAYLITPILLLAMHATAYAAPAAQEKTKKKQT